MAKKKEIIEKDPNREHTAVIYGDGSAINTQGTYGAGSTGYIYSNLDIDVKCSDAPTKYNITTMGYIENEVYSKENYPLVCPEYYFEGIFGYHDIGTNNRAEMLSFIETVDKLLEDTRFNLKRIIFKSDSEYTLKVIEYTSTLSEREWKIKLQNNVDLVEKIYNTINRLNSIGIKLDCIKVLGHSTSLGNNLADRLSNIARINKIHKFIIVPNEKKHWSRKFNIDPLLQFRQLFFINTKTNEPMYAIMDYKTSVEPGIKTHEAVFGIIVPKEPISYIEDTITSYSNNLYGLALINTMDLNTLYNRDNTYYYELLGKDIFSYNRKNNTLVGINNDTVVKSVYPQGLAIQAYDNMLGLYNIIDDYRNDKTTEFKFIDITDKFYNIVPDGKKIKYVYKLGNNDTTCEFKLKEVKGIGKKIEIILSLGKDTLGKNQFKAIEKRQPKIILVLHKSDETIYYKTIVDDNDGNIGIYYNIYSCKIY